MKYLKIPWYLVKGLVMMILFTVVVMSYPVFLIPTLLMEIGGMSGVSDKLTEMYSRILGMD